MTTPTTTLYARVADGIGLPDALARAGFRSAVALLSTPTAHTVAQVRDGDCRTPAGPCDLAEVFEARIFNPEMELRWLHEAGGLGRAVVLGEDEAALPAAFGDPLAPLHAIEVLAAHYLLWGRPVDDTPEGWTTLYTARVGVLRVPATVSTSDHRLRLVAREYVVVEPRHGNAYVGEERLLGLEETPVPAPARQGEGRTP